MIKMSKWQYFKKSIKDIFIWTYVFGIPIMAITTFIAYCYYSDAIFLSGILIWILGIIAITIYNYSKYEKEKKEN
jgi:hypothetical protein